MYIYKIQLLNITNKTFLDLTGNVLYTFVIAQIPNNTIDSLFLPTKTL